MRKVSFLVVGMMMGAAVVLSSCNTVAGAGKDVSSTGQAMTTAANNNKPATPPQ